LGHRTTKGLYEGLRDHPFRGHRFANSISIFASRIPLDPLIAKYDWESLGSATIVDVGGGYGPVSIGLAKKFPRLKFIVQDFEDVVAEGPNHVPAEISDRMSFMAYDMMNPQIVEGADVYFFRAVFHNWTDHYCVKILRNHIPALKSGARLLINDSCLHEPGSIPWYQEKRKR
jgi:trans-aconitate methyltransferase